MPFLKYQSLSNRQLPNSSHRIKKKTVTSATGSAIGDHHQMWRKALRTSPGGFFGVYSRRKAYNSRWIYTKGEKRGTKDPRVQYKDTYRFEYNYSSYVHHGHLPMIGSLTELTENTQILALMPKRRPVGSPNDTISVRVGDDAMLCSVSMLACADGISEWGVDKDAGLWARSNLETMSRNLTSLKNKIAPETISGDQVAALLDDSYQRTVRLMREEHLEGSSTLLVAVIMDKILQIASIGDCKLFIFRDGKICFENQIQMDSPLCPRQIGTNSYMKKLPSELAWFETFPLQENDILILCSDGLVDNLWIEEIEKFTYEVLYINQSSLQLLADLLVYKSKESALDSNIISPYIDKVNELKNTYMTGGKMDDISVTVARVLKNV